MRTNTMGEPVYEETIYASYGLVAAFQTSITDEIRDKAIALLCEKLNVSIVLTNATKRGAMELVLRSEEESSC